MVSKKLVTNELYNRKGKCANALNIAKELISDISNWYDIDGSGDYNFPDILQNLFSNALAIVKIFNCRTTK